jgi:hypothetical protein
MLFSVYAAFPVSVMKDVMAHLWCLRLDLAGTGKRAVDLSHGCGLFEYAEMFDRIDKASVYRW